VKATISSPRLLATALTLTLAVAAASCGSSNHDRADDKTNTPVNATTVASTPTTMPRPRPVQAVDKVVRIQRGRLHLRCNGRGSSTVLLIAGWDNSGDQGWSPVQPTIAKRTRVCSYDRFGTGTSDAPKIPQTFATEAADLHDLLNKAGEPGPYIVVGHSFGGAEAVDFASHYRDDVVSLMLIDASPTTWPTALCALPDDGTPTAREFRTTCGVFHHPQLDAEKLDAFPAFAAVAKIKTLGNLPIIVMTGAQRTFPGLAAPQLARLTKVWNAGAARWAALSTASKIVPVEHTGHFIQGEHPDLVIKELNKLIPQG